MISLDVYNAYRMRGMQGGSCISRSGASRHDSDSIMTDTRNKVDELCRSWVNWQRCCGSKSVACCGWERRASIRGP